MALAFDLPRSVPWPSSRERYRSRSIVDGMPIPRRRREGRAGAWKPRRWLMGLPALLDEQDADAWLAWAAPGVEVAYHCGPSLAEARQHDPTLDLLARALLARSSAAVLGITAPPCGHLRRLWQGSRDVELVQRRVGPSHWLYLARRL